MLVAVLALSSVVICSLENGESDASGEQTVSYYVLIPQGGTRNLDLVINENYFKSIDENYTVKWEYLTENENGESVYTVFSLTTPETASTVPISGTNGLFNFSLTPVLNSVGEYSLLLKDMNAGQTTTQLNLRCSITVSVRESSNVSLTYDTEYLYLTFNLSLGDGSVLPEVTTYNVSTYDSNEDGVSDSLPINWITIEEGEPVEMIPEYSNTVANPSSFYWYAVDLPKGLAMTSTGKIVGVPVNHSQEATVATVYVEDGYGKSTSYNVHIVVSVHELRNKVKYYLYDGEFTSASNGELISSPTEYITQRGEETSLLIYPGLGLTSNPVSKVEVIDKVLPEEGGSIVKRVTLENPSTYVENGPYKYYVYSLPTTGSGIYTVKMYNSSDFLVGSFDIYVMSKLLAVESAIIVGSDSSS